MEASLVPESRAQPLPARNARMHLGNEFDVVI